MTINYHEQSFTEVVKMKYDDDDELNDGYL